MPRGKTEKASCDLCCDALEKGQDVLKCEGECGCIVHRYCAGVTKRHFDSLGKGHLPFICQWCSLKTFKTVFEQLQSEIASLQSELAATKEALTEQSKQAARISSPDSYAAVVSQPSNQGGRHHPRQCRQRPQHRAPSNVSTTAVSSNSSTAAISASATTEALQARVRVEGARRIWGTHLHATTRTVQNAIE